MHCVLRRQNLLTSMPRASFGVIVSSAVSQSVELSFEKEKKVANKRNSGYGRAFPSCWIFER